jgi:hypothetical protein
MDEYIHRREGYSYSLTNIDCLETSTEFNEVMDLEASVAMGTRIKMFAAYTRLRCIWLLLWNPSQSIAASSLSGSTSTGEPEKNNGILPGAFAQEVFNVSSKIKRFMTRWSSYQRREEVDCHTWRG